MWNAIKRIIEFIKFVIGSLLIGMGVVVGGVAKFVARLCNRAIRVGIVMASDLRSRYLDIGDSDEIEYDPTDVVEVD